MLCHAKYYAVPDKYYAVLYQILCCAMTNIMLCHDKYLGYAEKLFRLCRIPKPRGQIIFY